jgi:hypothetical protein
METLLASALYVSYVQGKCAAIHKERQAKSRVERKAGTWDEISCRSRPEDYEECSLNGSYLPR